MPIRWSNNSFKWEALTLTILVRDTITNKQGEAWQWLQDVWSVQAVSDANYSLKQEGRQRLHFAAWKDLLQYFCGPEKLSQKELSGPTCPVNPHRTVFGLYRKVAENVVPNYLAFVAVTMNPGASKINTEVWLTLKAIENQSKLRVHRLTVNITNRRATCFPRWQYFMLIYIQMACTSFSLNFCITARFLCLESALISDICKSTFSLSITCITAAGPMADLL